MKTLSLSQAQSLPKAKAAHGAPLTVGHLLVCLALFSLACWGGLALLVCSVARLF